MIRAAFIIAVSHNVSFECVHFTVSQYKIFHVCKQMDMSSMCQSIYDFYDLALVL